MISQWLRLRCNSISGLSRCDPCGGQDNPRFKRRPAQGNIFIEIGSEGRKGV